MLDQPEPYAFAYNVDDGYGTTQEREETQDAYGNVKGSYGYMDANGIFRKVSVVCASCYETLCNAIRLLSAFESYECALYV